jgi:hypothetical protein
MDFDEYQKAYFVFPQPKPRFHFTGLFGLTLYYEDFKSAVTFYEQVLGPVGYQEGDNTRGWAIGNGWLTLLRGKQGNPRNMEISFKMESVEAAEALQQAFIQAGAKGSPPSDQLMFVPVRICPVIDPFGVDVMIFAERD